MKEFGLSYKELERLDPEAAVDSRTAEFIYHGAGVVLGRQGISLQDRQVSLDYYTDTAELAPFNAQEFTGDVLEKCGKQVAFRALIEARKLALSSDLNGSQRAILERLNGLRREIG